MWSGQWICLRGDAADEQKRKSKALIAGTGHSADFFRKLIEKEYDSRGRGGPGQTGRSLANRTATERRIATTNKVRACQAYLEAIEEFKKVKADDVSDPELDQLGWEDPSWDRMDDQVPSRASLVDARAGLIALKKDGATLPSTQQAMRDWMMSDEVKEAQDWCRWLDYDNSLDELEARCIDRVEALKKRKERMGYQKRSASSVSVNLRVRDADKAYEKYCQVYDRLPGYNKPEKIPPKPWEHEDMLSTFTRVRDGRAFAAEDWAQPKHRDGISAVRLLDCAVLDAKHAKAQRARLISWLKQEPYAWLESMGNVLSHDEEELNLWTDRTAASVTTIDKSSVLTYYRLLEKFGHMKSIVEKIRSDLHLPYQPSPVAGLSLEDIPCALTSRFVHYDPDVL